MHTAPASGEAFLVAFHTRLAGATPQALRAMTGEGPDSYERLLACVEAGDQCVLDLGCGDAELLVRLHGRRPDVHVAGIDLCDGEIVRGRARLPVTADLRCARAQSLPWASESFDLVLSHMALMLMDDAPTVLAEAARVLRPGGRLAAVMGAGLGDTPAAAAYRRTYESVLAASAAPLPRLGDARIRRPDTLCALLETHFEPPELQTFDRRAAGTPQALWEQTQLTYDAGWLAVPQREAWGSALRAEWQAQLDGGEPPELVWRLRLLTTRRRGLA